MRWPPRIALNLTLAVTLVWASGCKNNSLPVAPKLPSTPANAEQALFSVKITGSAHSLATGTTLALSLAGESDSDQPVDLPTNAAPSWKTSDTTVATVSASGVVKGLRKGTVTITAAIKSPPREDSMTLTVLGPGDAPPAEPAGADLGDTGFDPLPDSGPGGYDSSDGDGQLPDTAGLPTADGISLAVFPVSPRVLVGEHLRLVSYQDQGGTLKPAPASWRISDLNVATIDESGVVTGLHAGTATISAAAVSYASLRQTLTLTVSNPVQPSEIQGIRIKPSRVTMSIGETFWLLCEVPTWHSELDAAPIRWEVGDPTVVTVSDTGQLTAVGPGRTTVTAIATNYVDGELSATIPVEVKNTASGY